jgi:hypothetical protein
MGLLVLVLIVRDQQNQADGGFGSEVEAMTTKIVWAVIGGSAAVVLTIAAAVAIYLWSVGRGGWEAEEPAPPAPPPHRGEHRPGSPAEEPPPWP